MENVILQLIKIVTALYMNGLADDENNEIYEEIKGVIKEIKIDNKASSGLGGEENVIEALRNTIEWMLIERCIKYNKEDLITRLSINFQGNNDYILIAKKSLEEEVLPSEARTRVINIMRELQFEKKKALVKKIVSKANAILNFSGEYVDLSTFINDHVTELTEVQVTGNKEAAGLVGGINFTDLSSIEEALSKGISLTTTEGGLNTGLKGLNKACGGSIPRGAYFNTAGLTHQYKSGLLLDLTLYLPMFNNPWMWDDKKIPMFIRISFENTVDQDIKVLYKKLYAIKHKKIVHDADINIEKAAIELKEHFVQNGYVVELLHYNPADFSVYDIFHVLNNYIEKGYEIHGLLLDYPGLIAHNTFGNDMYSKIPRTVEMIRNFCYPKGTTVFAGHQLSTQAKELARESTATFTKKVIGGGYYEYAKALDTKFDIELVTHIHKHIDGNAYLMFSKGKHRGGELIPDSHKHFCYKFEPYGIIPDEFEEDSRALYSLPNISEANTNIDWD